MQFPPLQTSRHEQNGRLIRVGNSVTQACDALIEHTVQFAPKQTLRRKSGAGLAVVTTTFDGAGCWNGRRKNDQKPFFCAGAALPRKSVLAPRNALPDDPGSRVLGCEFDVDPLPCPLAPCDAEPPEPELCELDPLPPELWPPPPPEL